MAVSLAEARLLQRLRRGEPAALQVVWDDWKHAIWSICKAMDADPEGARALLLAVYRDFPSAARGWEHEHALCCQVGALVYSVLSEALSLPVLLDFSPELPSEVADPTPEQVLQRIAEIPPLHRLVYLVDLFFHCPSAETSSILGISEMALRHARTQAAWALVASRGGRP